LEIISSILDCLAVFIYWCVKLHFRYFNLCGKPINLKFPKNLNLRYAVSSHIAGLVYGATTYIMPEVLILKVEALDICRACNGYYWSLEVLVIEVLLSPKTLGVATFKV